MNPKTKLATLALFVGVLVLLPIQPAEPVAGTSSGPLLEVSTACAQSVVCQEFKRPPPFPKCPEEHRKRDNEYCIAGAGCQALDGG